MSPSSSSSSPICSAAARIIPMYRAAGSPRSSLRSSVCAKPAIVASGVRRSWHASDTKRAKLSDGATEGTIERLMDDLTRLLEDDLQASQPEVRLGLSRAGVMGASKAIRISYGGVEKQIAADIECTVDLDPSQKGVHMSRFPELFEEAIEEVVIGEAFLIEVLAEHIATHIVERQRALRAQVHISARYPIERTTPVTGLPTQEMVKLIGIAAASSMDGRAGEARTPSGAAPPSRRLGGVRRLVGVEA